MEVQMSTNNYRFVDNESINNTLNKITNDIDNMTTIIENNVHTNIEEFYVGWKKFVFKENIINIAVGMIIAHSFKNTVNSMVIDLIMPIIIGLGVGTNVENLFVVLKRGENIKNRTYITLKEAKEDGAVTFNYGLFINIFFDLIFVTLCLYTALRATYKIKSNLNKKIIKKHLSND